ncbi:Stress-induced protein OsmC [Flavobacterium longum]|uniref:OsmC family protein n=1 Tax=Flavobacterium longum TaxID=1299340 RepID=UPI0039EACFC1
MTSKVTYVGGLRTESVHLQSGSTVLSDAPTDNHGKGAAFSPTDMIANSLATCMLTTMAIKADTMGIDLSGSTAEVTKVMQSDPRKIAKIIVTLSMTGTHEDRDRTVLERVGHHCPVALSLHPDLVQEITCQWR